MTATSHLGGGTWVVKRGWAWLCPLLSFGVGLGISKTWSACSALGGLGGQ